MALDDKLNYAAGVLFEDDPLANMATRGFYRGASALGKGISAGLQRLRRNNTPNIPDEDVPQRPQKVGPESGEGPSSPDGENNWSWLKSILTDMAGDLSSIKNSLIESLNHQEEQSEKLRLEDKENQVENKNTKPVLVKPPESENKKSGGLLGLLGVGIATIVAALTSVVSALAGAATAFAASFTAGLAGSIVPLMAGIVAAAPFALIVAAVGAAFMAWWKFGGGQDAALKGIIGDGSTKEDAKLGTLVEGPNPEDANFLGDVANATANGVSRLGMDWAGSPEQIAARNQGIEIREMKGRINENIKRAKASSKNYWNKGQVGMFSDSEGTYSEEAQSRLYSEMDQAFGLRLRQSDYTRQIMTAAGKRKSADLTENEAKAQGDVVTEGLSNIIKENMKSLKLEYDKLEREKPYDYLNKRQIQNQLAEQEKLLNTLQRYNQQLKNPENDLTETIKNINLALQDFETMISGNKYEYRYGRGTRQIGTTRSRDGMPKISPDSSLDRVSTAPKFNERSQELMPRLMKDLNINEVEAAAILGNLGHESGGLVPGIQEMNPRRGRGGLGYAQWTGIRRRRFEGYARSRGMATSDPETNYQFLLHELRGTHRQALEALRNAPNNVKSKTFAFEGTFEKSGVKAYGSRLSYANKALELYASNSANRADKLKEVDKMTKNSSGTTPQNPIFVKYGGDAPMTPIYAGGAFAPPAQDKVQPQVTDWTIPGSVKGAVSR
jgi:hypothetical protein